MKGMLTIAFELSILKADLSAVKKSPEERNIAATFASRMSAKYFNFNSLNVSKSIEEK